MDWRIPEKEEVKRYYYQKMATCYRKFRTELTSVLREGRDPDFGKLGIEQQDWEEFCAYRMTAEFDVCLFL